MPWTPPDFLTRLEERGSCCLSEIFLSSLSKLILGWRLLSTGMPSLILFWELSRLDIYEGTFSSRTLLEDCFLPDENIPITEEATRLMLDLRPPFCEDLSYSFSGWFPWEMFDGLRPPRPRFNRLGLWSISLSFLRALESSFGGKSLVAELLRD